MTPTVPVVLCQDLAMPGPDDRPSAAGATRRSWVAAWLAALGAVTAAAACALPWARTGQRVRNSFELLDVAARADVLPAGVEGWARVWVAVPIGAGGTLLLLASLRPRAACALAASVGAITAAGSVLVYRSPVDYGAGPALAMVGAATALGSGLLGLAGRNGTEGP